jgi:hypothetical protein
MMMFQVTDVKAGMEKTAVQLVRGVTNFFSENLNGTLNLERSLAYRERLTEVCLYFFQKLSTNEHVHIHALTLTSINAHTHTPMSIFGRLAGELDLEIDEVITGASLSTETSSPTERIFHLYETHRYQT